jgi:putative transcriptional regulator
MTDSENFDALTGNLLLAMPGIADPFFSQTLTLICEHSMEGAMGLVINQPTGVSLQEVFEQLEFFDVSTDAMQKPIGYGDPVGKDQVFILHTKDREKKWSSSFEVMKGIELTVSQDIVEAVSKGNGPDKWLFVLGYAGWAAGQLETELVGDSWITMPATEQLIFDTPAEEQLKAAASNLGIEFSRLATTAGRA